MAKHANCLKTCFKRSQRIKTCFQIPGCTPVTPTTDMLSSGTTREKYTATYDKYNPMQYNIIQYNIWDYTIIQCNTMQYNAIQCKTMQYNLIQSNTIQYNPIQSNTI